MRSTLATSPDRQRFHGGAADNGNRPAAHHRLRATGRRRRRKAPGFGVDVTETGGTYEGTDPATARELGIQRLGLEGDYTDGRQFRNSAEVSEGDDDLSRWRILVAPLRLVKDEEEVRRIRPRLPHRGCRVCPHPYAGGGPGVMERDLAIELEYSIKKQGCETEAFGDTRRVRPAFRPATRPSLRPADQSAATLITFYFGARWEGYNSDLTRTVVVGRASEEQRKVDMTVLDAQLAAIAAIRPGAEAKQVDRWRGTASGRRRAMASASATGWGMRSAARSTTAAA